MEGGTPAWLLTRDPKGARGWFTVEKEKMLEVMAVDNERRGIRKC